MTVGSADPALGHESDWSESMAPFHERVRMLPSFHHRAFIRNDLGTVLALGTRGFKSRVVKSCLEHEIGFPKKIHLGRVYS